ncbi:L-serine ammonia-lyase, iron-sulfur-dependent, subunit alpha [Listeria monocytogenes]|nr:L-serine ammonia-lyase, iron-sulfur-dependent, subunit alpha [Listeria monocytogenes]
MFRTVAELVDIAERENLTIAEIMIKREMNISGLPREEITAAMERNLDIMEEAIREGEAGVTSTTGLTGGDAVLMQDYIKKGNFLSGEVLLDSVAKAIATNEVNASMGVICATPTAGSAGVVPGVLFSLKDRLEMSREDMVNFLFTAGAFGYVVANNAFISGAAGGCQAEIGSASAMAMTMKNMLGLVCDPVAGLVEVPCVKRNALGSSQAIISADMALAGIKSRIPCDEVIEAMHRVGLQMPSSLRETAEGGLAATPTGRAIQRKIFGLSPEDKRE